MITLRNTVGRTLMKGSRPGRPMYWGWYGRPVEFPTPEAAQRCALMLNHRAEVVTQSAAPFGSRQVSCAS